MPPVKKKNLKQTSRKLVKPCVRASVEKQVKDPIILDVSKLCSFTDYFVIISGRSTRHVQGLAEALEAELRSKRLATSKSEGLQEGIWVLLDFNDVVVHIFYSESRQFYDIEGLWHDAPRISLDD